MKVVKGSNVVRKGLSHESRAEGTTVTVRDLFYNRPVQRKMMWNARRCCSPMLQSLTLSAHASA
jgi:DNA mismatch repair ATPase MutL